MRKEQKFLGATVLFSPAGINLGFTGKTRCQISWVINFGEAESWRRLAKFCRMHRRIGRAGGWCGRG
jgi:hypothetical protein